MRIDVHRHVLTIANWVDFLEHVEERLTAEIDRVYAIANNLNSHHADAVPLFCTQNQHREFVLQPKYAVS
jgi:hypothetical protein